MARINVEDELWLDSRFKRLVKRLGTEPAALGAWVYMMRLAQEFYVQGRIIPETVWKDYQVSEDMIELEFAERTAEGIRVFDAEAHFSWIATKRESGKAGGIASGIARRNKNAELGSETKQDRTSASICLKQNPSETNPLTLSLPLSQKKEECLGDPEPTVLEPLRELASIFFDKRIPSALQKLWLERYTPEFVIEKVKDLEIWRATAGAKGRKSNWGRFYSNCFARDWDKWSRRLPSTQKPPEKSAIAKRMEEEQ